MAKKVVYPEPDPAHLCGCDCHGPENAAVNYFTGCVCCNRCDCGHLIAYRHWDEHKRACVPRKDRHKERPCRTPPGATQPPSESRPS